MNNPESIAVQNVIIGSAPEKSDELERLWNKYSPQINMTDDKEGFTLEAGSFGLVLFNHKTMAQIWLYGFAVQEAFNLFLPYLKLSRAIGISFNPNSLIEEDENNSSVKKVSDVIASIKQLKELDNIDHFQWPDFVPSPDSGKPKDENGSMAFDLLCMAAAYCFLHEIRHVQVSQSEEHFDSHDEELECDKYAYTFLLEDIEKYSNESGYDLRLLKNKRCMALALASTLLFVITPKKYWSGTETHPSIVSRISEITKSITIDENDFFWDYLCCTLATVVRLYEIPVRSKVINSAKEYSSYLLDCVQSHLTSGSR